MSKYIEAPPRYPTQHLDEGYISPDSEKYAQSTQHTRCFVNNIPPAELPLAEPSELPSDDAQSSTPILPEK